MFTAPRVHGVLLRSLARFARTQGGARALEKVMRAELKVGALGSLPDSLRGVLPLHNRAMAGRPPRVWEDARLPLPPSAQWPHTSADYVRAYSERKATPELVTQRVFDAARTLESRTPSMRVLLDYAEDSAKTDADASGDRYRAGVPRGALDGICIAVKEQTAVLGLPRRAGTKFIPGDPMTADATVVKRLRDAGAIIVGSTPMTEFGMTPLGFNPHRIMPKNPHDTNHVAGGSSTGSGVAVATGLLPIAIGADGGGSIRIPAALNGIYGIKPTWGRVSRYGDVGTDSVAHVGPLASSVVDLARVLEVIGAPDKLDPETAYAPPIAAGSLVLALSRGVRRVRIGVCESEWSDASSPVARAGKEALAALEREGAELVPVSIELARYASAIGYCAIGVEARSALREVWSGYVDELSPDLQITLSILEQLGAVEFLDTVRLRAGLRLELAKIFQQVDVLALPTTVDVAPAATAAQMASGFLDAKALDGLCRFNFMGSLAGLPACSVPVGSHRGLPIGLQLMGDAFDEATVLAVAAHLERIGVARAERPNVYVDIL